MIENWGRPEGVRLRVLLIRHGEPEASAKGRCYGKLDVGLSERGREQMSRLSQRLEPVELAAVYASPRSRAQESAEVLSRTVTTELRFGEIDFGELEGRTYEDVQARYPAIYHRWMHQPTEVKFPGGESFSEMKERVLDGMRMLRRAHDRETIAVVSHGGVNRIVLAEALGVADADIFHMHQSHAAVSVVDDYPDYSVVRVMNATC